MRTSLRSAFTTVEIIVGLVIVTLTGAVAVPVLFKVMEKSQAVSAAAEAKVLNNALGEYRALGSPVPSTTEAQVIIDTLKRPLSATAQKARGGVGQLLLPETGLDWSTTAERVAWDNTSQQFVVVTSGAGFRLNRKGSAATGTTDFAVTGQHFATRTNWIWDFDNRPSGKTATNIDISITGPSNPIIAAGAQTFTATASRAGTVSLMVGGTRVEAQGTTATIPMSFAPGSSFSVPVRAAVVDAEGNTKTASLVWVVNIPGVDDGHRVPISLIIGGPTSLRRSWGGTIGGAPISQSETFPWTYTYKDRAGTVFTRISSVSKPYTWQDPASRNGSQEYVDTVSWTEDGLTSTHSVRVYNYRVFTMTVTANPSAGGLVGGTSPYDEGATASIWAAPTNGYEWGNWTSGGAISKLVTMDSNKNEVAFFRLKNFTGTLDFMANGGSVGGRQVEVGASGTIPLSVRWSVSGANHIILSGNFFGTHGVGSGGTETTVVGPGVYTAHIDWWLARRAPTFRLVYYPDPWWTPPEVDPLIDPPLPVPTRPLATRWDPIPDGSAGAWDGALIQGPSYDVSTTVVGRSPNCTAAITAENNPTGGSRTSIAEGDNIPVDILTGRAPVTISWETTNSPAPSLSETRPGAHAVVPRGSESYQLDPGSYVYTIFATGLADSASASISFTVGAVPNSAISLRASNSGGGPIASGASIPADGSGQAQVILIWTSTNVSNPTLVGASAPGSVAGAGAVSVSLVPGDYTYTFSGTGSNGALSEVLSFTVTNGAQPPTINISATDMGPRGPRALNIFGDTVEVDPSTGKGKVLVAYTFAHENTKTLDGVPLDNYVGTKLMEEVPGTYTHTAEATGFGTASASVTYTVVAPTVTADLKAALLPTLVDIPSGGTVPAPAGEITVRLSWTTTNAQTRKLTGTGATGVLSTDSGSVDVTLPASATPYTYRLEAEGAGGAAPPVTLVFTVVNRPLPTGTFTASPPNSPNPTAVTLNWAITNATKFVITSDSPLFPETTISDAAAILSGTTTTVVLPSGTYNFTGTATNATGDSIYPATVTIGEEMFSGTWTLDLIETPTTGVSLARLAVTVVSRPAGASERVSVKQHDLQIASGPDRFGKVATGDTLVFETAAPLSARTWTIVVSAAKGTVVSVKGAMFTRFANGTESEIPSLDGRTEFTWTFAP